ncbi:MAG: Bug family tripartite tricarboxylate transporter substrate binding protein, partial [Burkholderiales bacterium]
PSPLAWGQAYPSKPVRLIVPWPAGGTTDILGRVIGQKLSETWGQPVVIENRGGAAGNIGTEVVVRAPADGYTLLFGNMGTHATNQFMYTGMTFDPVTDLAPLSLIANVGTVLVVHPNLPVKNVKDLVALAKARPGQLDYASGGVGSFNQLCAELLTLMTKINIVHVPYKGGAPAVADLLGGHVAMLFTGAPVTMSHIKAGKLKILAVTDSKRVGALPNVPTVGESIPGYEFNNWYGFLAPLKLPRAQVDKVNADLAKVLALPDVKERFSTLGADITPSTPEKFGALMKADAEKWGKVVKAAKIKAD